MMNLYDADDEYVTVARHYNHKDLLVWIKDMVWAGNVAPVIIEIHILQEIKPCFSVWPLQYVNTSFQVAEFL